MSESEAPDEAAAETDTGVRLVREVSADDGEVDLGDANGEVSGDVRPGGVVCGCGHLTVKGSVLGEPARPCRIVVAETLVVESGVRHAELRARHVVVLGDAAGVDIHSDLGVAVRGNLSDSNVSLGYRTGEIQTLKQLRKDFLSVTRDLEQIEVRLAAGARRFVRDYPQIDLNLGSVLQPAKGRLRVDLSPLYKALGERSTEDMDKALREFFLKVVVGTLTRANRHYVSQNPSRQRIFLKVIEELREHLGVVRRADAIRARLSDLEATREQMLASLNRPVPLDLKVRGQVSGACRVRALCLSNVRETSTGAVEMDETWAETKCRPGEDGWELESRGRQGRKRVTPLADLRAGRFELQEEEVSWIPDA